MDKICPTFAHFSLHEWKLTKFSLFLMTFLSHLRKIHFLWNFQVILSKFSISLSDFYKKLWNLMKVYKITLKLMKFQEIPWYIITFISFYAFHILWLPVLAFKSWPQKFCLIQAWFKLSDLVIAKVEKVDIEATYMPCYPTHKSSWCYILRTHTCMFTLHISMFNNFPFQILAIRS